MSRLDLVDAVILAVLNAARVELSQEQWDELRRELLRLVKRRELKT
jgi:hypothetical protein